MQFLMIFLLKHAIIYRYNSTKMKPKKDLLKIEINIGGISDVDIMLFTKHLSVILRSGLTLIEALEMLAEQSKGKLKKIIGRITERVRAGDAFHQALSEHGKYFTQIYLNMVKSGEISGTLHENLERLSVELKKSLSLKKKVKSAMIYPMLVFVAVFGLGMLVALFVLPQIVPLFKSMDVELPLTTRGLIYIAEIFAKYGIKIAISFCAVVIFGTWLLRRNFIKPYTHAFFLRLPIIKKIIHDINLERFTRTFGSLLETGLTVDQSLKITGEAIENRVYRKAILAMIPEVESGSNLKTAISAYPDIFPLIVSRMIGVGEKTGSLDSTLKYLSEFYEEEVDETVKNLSTIIEPIMLIFIGIIVGTVAIAILGPIYEITGSLK